MIEFTNEKTVSILAQTKELKDQHLNLTSDFEKSMRSKVFKDLPENTLIKMVFTGDDYHLDGTTKSFKLIFGHKDTFWSEVATFEASTQDNSTFDIDFEFSSAGSQKTATRREIIKTSSSIISNINNLIGHIDTCPQTYTSKISEIISIDSKCRLLWNDYHNEIKALKTAHNNNLRVVLRNAISNPDEHEIKSLFKLITDKVIKTPITHDFIKERFNAETGVMVFTELKIQSHFTSNGSMQFTVNGERHKKSDVKQRLSNVVLINGKPIASRDELPFKTANGSVDITLTA